MGAPTISFRRIVSSITSKIHKETLGNSVLFYIPPLATTLATFALFRFIKGFSPSDINTLQVTIMSSVIVSLIGTAPIQFIMYHLIDSDSQTSRLKNCVGKILFVGIGFSMLLSTVLLVPVYIYFQKFVELAYLNFSYIVILVYAYAAIWVITAAFWASRRYKFPAIIFTISYIEVFFLTGWMFSLNPVFAVPGYIGGVIIMLAALIIASKAIFKSSEQSSSFSEILLAARKTVGKGYWGILFQTLFLLAIFLDKIIVWVLEGLRMGNGLYMVGPYTTGAFLGMVPTFSLVALAYFSERVRPLSKHMYSGRLVDMEKNVALYKSSYRKSMQSMIIIECLLLIFVVLLSVLLVGDIEVTLITSTIGVGLLFFQGMLFNAFILPIFAKSHVSALSMGIVCLCEIIVIPLISYNMLFAALGFLSGSLIGFLISNRSTEKLLAAFHRKAFLSFVTVS